MRRLASLPDLWHLFMIFQAFTLALDVSGANKHKLGVISLSYKNTLDWFRGEKMLGTFGTAGKRTLVSVKKV